MAANYSQYTDHNEIGGVSVGLEDAKLAAADSVDEVTATDCVLMKDASGNPVKILKEDFNEAVRDALGSILSLNPLGTAIGKVAALGSSDNDFGSISTSDLASVLGVKYPNIPVFVDANTGNRLVRIYSLTANYIYAITKIVCRDTGSNNRLIIDVILSERGNYSFNKIEGSPVSVKFYKDDRYLYVWFAIYNNATITYVGGSNVNEGYIGGVIMPSADVSGMTEVVVP